MPTEDTVVPLEGSGSVVSPAQAPRIATTAGVHTATALLKGAKVSIRVWAEGRSEAIGIAIIVAKVARGIGASS